MGPPLFARGRRDANVGLQGQIREMLVAAILDGQLPAGVPIPSSREMAEQLGVARNTVVLAYQQLADEGYLVSRQRSGHFVNTEGRGGAPGGTRRGRRGRRDGTPDGRTGPGASSSARRASAAS